ncbi:type VI secretion system protein TssA [Paludibaculum fermentans]|uniref:Type VI secretion system protein TssA n=1 Tax=Paludibaculum fermentans TaxID=1473598 RepID=A0A7S7NPX0_PALFE|nr:type VI secretion system protein TssA [Paludibaculum fermentans]QOY87618.1 type VI secretion system protein TssA [Paludibaculum fermentans]
MPLREDILSPIAGDNPSGQDIRYTPLFEQIKEARREEEALSQGVWQRVLKTADWPLVIRLISEALAKKSKDLQLAVWLAEALVRRDGFTGLQEGVNLCNSLLAEFWDSLYPELEDGDPELRSVPLAWLASKLDTPLRQVPLTPHGISALQFAESLQVPSEEEAGGSSSKADARREAVNEGKTTPEAVDEALRATQSAFFGQNIAVLEAARESVDQLNLIADERFGEYSPGFSDLKECLDQLINSTRILSQRRAAPGEAAAAQPAQRAERQQQAWVEDDKPLWSSSPADDDTPLWQTSDSTPSEEPQQSGFQEETPLWQSSVETPSEPANIFEESPQPQHWSHDSGSSGGFQAREPADAVDCAARLNSIAQWLRKANPRSPAAYLLLRGFRWGELRALGAELDPEWLEAPPTDIRQQMRRFAQEEDWAQLLEAGEEAMAQPYGRAWLDLQRYSLMACDELGEEYGLVSHSIVGALSSLLQEYPDLLESTLTDDTPTANAATRQMLAAKGCLPNSKGPTRPAPALPDRNDDTMIEDAIRRGRVEVALELVSRRMALETSGRGRFQRKIQLARILVASGRHAVSLPLLRELSAEISQRGLSEWEMPAIVVEPLVLLYRCLEHEPEAADERKSVYTLICRLDPVKAFELS